MNPQNQPIPPAPKDSYASPQDTAGDYGFIMNNQTPPAAKGGSSTTKRILLVLGLVVILGVIGVIIANLFAQSSNKIYEDMALLVSKQNEMIYIADVGSKGDRNPETQNLAINTKQALSTDRDNIIAYLTTNKHPVTKAQQGALKYPTVDTQLLTAQQNNQYDQALTTMLKTKLLSYQQAVKDAYQEADGKNAKSILSDTFDNINILVGANGID